MGKPSQMECASSDSKNRAAAGFIQRFQNTAMCSTGLGAEPQQAETHSFRRSEMDGVFRICNTNALLATTISVSSLPKCLAYLPLDYSAIFSIIKKKGEKT